MTIPANKSGSMVGVAVGCCVEFGAGRGSSSCGVVLGVVVVVEDGSISLGNHPVVESSAGGCGVHVSATEGISWDIGRQ